jgi:GNAT superfamily N-acetyltransferase
VVDRFNDERLRRKEQALCAAYLSLKNRELQRPDYQSQGVGTMILQALEAAAVNAGIKRLAVAATLNSAPFYTARGFSSRGASSYQHANGFSLPCVSMNKVVG